MTPPTLRATDMAGGRRRVRKDISPFLNALMNAARADKLSFTRAHYENPIGEQVIDWGAFNYKRP